ncbi:hypothetical protein ACFE04_025717 [Oxalis oulophora]
MDNENSSEKDIPKPSAAELEGNENNAMKANQAETPKEIKSEDNINDSTKLDNADDKHDSAILDSSAREEVSNKSSEPEDFNKLNESRSQGEKVDDKIAENHLDVQKDKRSLEFEASEEINQKVNSNVVHENLGDDKNQIGNLESKSGEEANQTVHDNIVHDNLSVSNYESKLSEPKSGEEANQTVHDNIVHDNLSVSNDESKLSEPKSGEEAKNILDDNMAHDNSGVSKDESKQSEPKTGEEANQSADKNIAEEDLFISKVESKAGEETNPTKDKNLVHENLGVINDESKLLESKTSEETQQSLHDKTMHDNADEGEGGFLDCRAGEESNQPIGKNIAQDTVVVSKDENKHTESKAGEETNENADKSIVHENLADNKDESKLSESKTDEESNKNTKENSGENTQQEQVSDSHAEGSALSEKATALKNFVKERGIVAVASLLRRISGRPGEESNIPATEDKTVVDPAKNSENSESSKMAEKSSSWNPLAYLRTADPQNKAEPGQDVVQEPTVITGRIILYTRLGCSECKEARSFLFKKRLGYVEVNIDVFPSRKHELEKLSGSSAVPKVFFNEILIGGLSEIKSLDECGKLDEKIEQVTNVAPPDDAPQPPLSGEDDTSNGGAVDELAPIVKKMKESIIVRDRFFKFRRVTSCFLGSDAVTFLSEDQSLERPEAIEFGQKLASQVFFQHVFDENLLEDGNHLYRFLEDDPIVLTQCHNIPKGVIDLKPKPIVEIASRLRFLSYAIFEAYTSEDGRHVDYRSIHASEEFARYLRVVQELQRAELQDMSREEKLAFFINLYNMMAIHSILEWGFPAGPLERRRLFSEFKYVIGGCTYSLSDIQSGILRGNQRPPYNLLKPFGAREKRSKVSLLEPEALIHFALVFGSRSGPALRCYSPGSIDEELTAAASGFLTGGGLIIDSNTKVASANKILKWYSVDFGKSEMEVLKFASKYLETTESEGLLQLVGEGHLKVMYQIYDWGINC